jgi:intracellular septation protein
MLNLLRAAKLLLLDMASTVFFLILYLLTKNIVLAVLLGIVFGFCQIGWSLVRRQPIDAMQWVSLFLVVASGAATLLTNDPRFVMVKPSLIYLIVGVVMLKPGWMNRYTPPIALTYLSDVVVVFGYIWAGLMFISAALNLILVLEVNTTSWALVMSAYGPLSKICLFSIQYATMRFIGARRAAHYRALGGVPSAP